MSKNSVLYDDMARAREDLFAGFVRLDTAVRCEVSFDSGESMGFLVEILKEFSVLSERLVAAHLAVRRVLSGISTDTVEMPMSQEQVEQYWSKPSVQYRRRIAEAMMDSAHGAYGMNSKEVTDAIEKPKPPKA